VNQKQLPKESELTNCHIGRSGSLKTLHTADTDTNVGGLNHRNIVGAVTNSQEKSLLVTLDKLNNQSFLKRGNTTKGRLE
jgi:hypothetical protein